MSRSSTTCASAEEGQVTEKFFLEHYGQAELLVWKPLFDREAVMRSRTALPIPWPDDGREIIAVANFVEPFLGDYQEA